MILFGSSLNPMTQAHLEIIKKLSAAYPDAQIRVVPVYRHPDPKILAPYADRLAMSKQVIHNRQEIGQLMNVQVSDIEKIVYKAIEDEIALELVSKTLSKPFISYEKAGNSAIDRQTYYHQELTQQLQSLHTQNKASYEQCQANIAKLGLRTVRLLTYLKANEPDTDFSLALGADTLNALLAGNWSQGDSVINACASLIYFTRAKSTIPVIKSPIGAIQKAIDCNPSKFERLEVFQEQDALFKNVSSTYFRELRDEPAQLTNTVPIEVLKYVYHNKLYGFSDDFCDRATVLAWYQATYKVGTLMPDDENRIKAEVARRQAAQSKALQYIELN